MLYTDETARDVQVFYDGFPFAPAPQKETNK